MACRITSLLNVTQPGTGARGRCEKYRVRHVDKLRPRVWLCSVQPLLALAWLLLRKTPVEVTRPALCVPFGDYGHFRLRGRMFAMKCHCRRVSLTRQLLAFSDGEIILSSSTGSTRTLCTLCTGHIYVLYVILKIKSGNFLLSNLLLSDVVSIETKQRQG